MRKLVFFLLVISAMFAKENFTVFGASPPATCFLYSLDPKVIAGRNYAFKDKELKFLDKQINKLPMIGGWFGQGKTPNFETLIKVNPSLIITWNYNNSFKNVDEKLHTLGFKTFSINIDSLNDYVNAYIDVGKILSMEDRAGKLSSYVKDKMDELNSLKKSVSKKKTVYYAEGVDGLQTECNSSIHADLIEYIGAYNPHRCENKTGFGRDRISLEQLMIYNPDIIVTQELSFYKNVYKDKKLKHLKAVKEKKVFLIPKSPFSWFDRPPSFMKVLGAQWLGDIVYKDVYNIDIKQRIKEFYKLFLNVSLTNEEIKYLLEGK